MFVQLYGHYYGTSRSWILEQQTSGRHVILVIDTQGAVKLKGSIDATFIFLTPPSYEALRERLTKRQTESSEMVEERLRWAEKEMEAVKNYDYKIVNDDLKIAYQVLRSIIIAEEHKVMGSK